MGMVGRKTVADVLKEAGIEFKAFSFEGSCLGENYGGFPTYKGDYSTVRYGRLESFKRGDNDVGDWVKVYEYYSPGDAWEPSYYKAYYVRRRDYKKALKLLQDAGFKHVKVVRIPEVEEEEKRLREYIRKRLGELDLLKLTKIVEIIDNA